MKFKAIITLSIIALINAAYLSAKARWLFEWNTFCDINSRRSCANVVAHPAAYIGPIPFPAIALVVYPILLILAIIGLRSRTPRKYFKTLSVLSGLWILFNAYIIYQETYVIKAFCPLCLLCTAVIITIFIVSLLGYKKKK